MIALKSGCLSENDLQAVLNGGLAQEQFDSAISHMDNCEHCRSAAETFQQDGKWITDFLRGDHDDPLQAETDCQIALWRMLETPVAAVQGLVESVPFAELGPYRLLQSLGTGGMGTVYLAEHIRLKRQCAIKILPKDRVSQAGWLERFDREMTTVAALEHPNVVRATDAGHKDGWHYLVMEHLDGLDVGRVASRMGQLKIANACEIVRQTALGLAHIHDSGLVHRDIKPSNLMLTRKGDVKLLDLGLVLSGDDPLGVDDRLTTVGHLMGTIPYMAPEQLSDSRDVDPRADIYSLGATLFRLISGRPPHQRRRGLASHILQITDTDAPELSSVRENIAQSLNELSRQMLSRTAGERPNAAEVAERLQALAEGSQLKGLLRESLRRRGKDNEPAVSMLAATNGNSNPPTSRIRKWLFGGFFAAAMVLAAIVFKIQTDVGDLIVHSEQDGLKVLVSSGGKTVKELTIEANQKSKTVLRKGTYRVEIVGGGDALKLSDEVVTISRGETETVSIKKVTNPGYVNPFGKAHFRDKTFEQWMSILQTSVNVDEIGTAMVAVVALSDESNSNSTQALSAMLHRARQYGGLRAKTPPSILMNKSGASESEQFMFYLRDSFSHPDSNLLRMIPTELREGNGRSRAACLFMVRNYDWNVILKKQEDSKGRLLLNDYLQSLAKLTEGAARDENWAGLDNDDKNDAIIEAYQYGMTIALIRKIDPLSIPPLNEVFQSRKSSENLSPIELTVKAIRSGKHNDILAASNAAAAVDGNLSSLYRNRIAHISAIQKTVSPNTNMSGSDEFGMMEGGGGGASVDIPETQPQKRKRRGSVDESFEGMSGLMDGMSGMMGEGSGLMGMGLVDAESEDAESETDALLFQGNNLKSWMRLLGREQDPESLGNIMRAVSVLSKDDAGKRMAAAETLKIARILGGVAYSNLFDGFGTSQQHPSQAFMGHLLQTYPKYFPEPGLDAISDELKNGTSNSRIASIMLLNNFLTGVEGDTWIQGQQYEKEIRRIAASDRKETLDVMYRNLQAAAKAIGEDETVPDQLVPSIIVTAEQAGLRLQTIRDRSIVGDEWLEPFVWRNFQLAKTHASQTPSQVSDSQMQNWAVTPLTSFFGAAGFGTGNYVGLSEDMLLSAVQIIEHHDRQSEWDFVMRNLLLRDAVRSKRCEPIVAALVKNIPQELWSEIDSELLVRLVPLVNQKKPNGEEMTGVGGMDMEMSMEMDFDEGNLDEGGMGGGGVVVGGVPLPEYCDLMRPESLWPSLLNFYAQNATRPSESLAILQKLRKANNDYEPKPKGFALTGIDAAIKTLRDRTDKK